MNRRWLLLFVVPALAACASGGGSAVAPPGTEVAPVDSVLVNPDGSVSPYFPPSGQQLPFTGPQDDFDRCQERAGQAHIAFQPARKMIVGQDDLVEVIVSLDQFTSTPSLPGGGEIATESAKLTCEISAQLTGTTSSFDITPQKQNLRSFENGGPIVFKWAVTPKKVGQTDLILNVLPKVTSDADPQGTVDAPLVNDAEFTAHIVVTAKPQSFGDRVTGFFRNVVNYPLVSGFSSLVAVAGGALIVWRRVARPKNVDGDEREDGSATDDEPDDPDEPEGDEPGATRTSSVAAKSKAKATKAKAAKTKSATPRSVAKAAPASKRKSTRKAPPEADDPPG